MFLHHCNTSPMPLTHKRFIQLTVWEIERPRPGGSIQSLLPPCLPTPSCLLSSLPDRKNSLCHHVLLTTISQRSNHLVLDFPSSQTVSWIDSIWVSCIGSCCSGTKAKEVGGFPRFRPLLVHTGTLSRYKSKVPLPQHILLPSSVKIHQCVLLKQENSVLMKLSK